MEQNNTRFWLETSILIVITVVLQMTASVVKIGPLVFTFVLIPIIVAAVLHGILGGVIMGFTFGLTVLVQSLLGLEPFGFMLLGIDWISTLIIILGRATVLGLLVALLHKMLQSTMLPPYITATILSILAPLINTGIFVVLFYFLFKPTLIDLAGEGADPLSFLILTMVGVNVIVEVVTTAILSPPILMALKRVRDNQ